MKVHLVFPKLPPAHDGIGDYTACLAAALAESCRVTILTAQEEYHPIPGVTVQQALSTERLQGIAGFLEAVAQDPPDWLVLQYNAFSYGRRGWNPYLPRAVRALKRKHPGVRLALMVHELAAAPHTWRLALMSIWHYVQLWLIGREADLIFASIEPWVTTLQRWFGKTPVRHLPVGSNLPYHAVSREAARNALGFGRDTFVIGVFGMARPVRLLGYVREAVEAVRRESKDVRVLYVGTDGAKVKQALGDLPLHDAGRVEADDISRYFAAMDLYLAPFKGGVSTRRGSFMVALQNGVATVSTAGHHTGPVLRDAHDQAFLLAADDDPGQYRRYTCDLYRDPTRRAEIGRAGQDLFQAVFSWEAIAAQCAAALRSETEPAR